MQLKKIVKNLDIEYTKGELNLEIDDISYDSRSINKNSLFIAIEGFETDGHKYIEDAISKGAKVIVIEKNLNNYLEEITYIKVKDSRKAMAYISAEFYENPQKELKLIGVTGTNGKTTTTKLIRSILERAGHKTGLIGTIGNYINKEEISTSRTTPNSLELNKFFNKMRKQGVEYVIMEVSSHAIDLKRVFNLDFEIAVFTNITQDHLDYHKTFDNYIKVKSKLFNQVKNNGYSIVNIDDDSADRIINSTNSKIIKYSLNQNSDFQAKNIDLNTSGVSFKINNFEEKIYLNITGKFNIYNALAAIAVASVLNIDYNTIKEGLEKIDGIPGRFELIKERQNFTVIVDYAHTADGMENVLKTIEDLLKNKVIIVFGCGGDRDKDKRPKMGKVAAEYGDYIFITTDNPRSERPESIIEDIEKGLLNNEGKYEIIVDRKDAINNAIKMAEKNDIVVIFGKGHETYQVFKDKTIHFDDREVAREAIRSKKERV
ncbi:MAG: UDP-N-acetylmuramoyl-L-alanyl-D-glutamate--2,6-diaminopimelate ligase [Bacillota bacterium]